MTEKLPEAAAALYLVSPEEFTAERDRVARELKQMGEVESARQVKALKRPTVAAYALNLVSSREPAQIKELLAADEQLRNARTRDEMQEAKSRRQKTINSITSAALSVLAEQDRPQGSQIREKIAETLLAVANDDEARVLLEEGRLTREISPAGFGSASAFGSEEPGETGGAADDRKIGQIKQLRAEADAQAAEGKRLRLESKRLTEESRRLEREAERMEAKALKAEQAAQLKLKQADELES